MPLRGNVFWNAQIMCDLWKGSHFDLSVNMKSWKCGVCEHILLSKAGYVNHLKGYNKSDWHSWLANYTNLPNRPADNTWVCNKFYRSSSGLKRYLVVHRWVVGHADPINPIKDTEFICHIYMIPIKLNVGLKSYFKGHGLWNETKAITSDMKGKEAALIRVKCGNNHIYI